jgi:hypothetical protein
MNVLQNSGKFAIALLTTITLCSSCLASSEEHRFHRVTITVVAHESTLRTSMTNRDAYRMRVQTSRGETFEALAVDAYPSYEDELPSGLQAEGLSFSVRLKRSPDCDRTPPNAVLSGTLPCFSLEHGSWKIPRGMRLEQAWWR